ncbi:MAG: hypothetical protein KJN72_12215 [Woeseia sp.]|nr:hypothetical protein [Woeseia sp.]
MSTKDVVDLIENTLRDSLEQARQNGGGARFVVERLDGKPRRPDEPCVKLRAYAGDKQAYLLYIGTPDGEAVKRITYNSKFLVNPVEYDLDKITATQIIADVVTFSIGTVAPLTR